MDETHENNTPETNPIHVLTPEECGRDIAEKFVIAMVWELGTTEHARDTMREYAESEEWRDELAGDDAFARALEAYTQRANELVNLALLIVEGKILVDIRNNA